MSLKHLPINGIPLFAYGEDHLTTHLDFSKASVDRLNPSLTINSLTETPVFRYKGGDADGTNWPAWGYGETLTLQAGTVPSYNQGSPLPGSNDDSVLFNSGGYYQAGNNSFAGITTEDIVFESVLRIPTIAAEAIMSKREAGGTATGAESYLSGGGALSYAIDTGATTRVVASSAVSAGTWAYAICFLDRSGSGQWYINGLANGSAANISAAAASLSVAVPFGIGARPGGSVPYGSNIAYLAMWKRDAWLDTHLQAAVAKERFAQLASTYLAFAAGTTRTPTVMTRASSAYLDKLESGNRKLYMVGDNWPRVIHRAGGNAELKGYLPEPEKENLQVYSQDFDNAAWTKVRSSIIANSYAAPDGSLTADTLKEDATASSTHYIHDSTPAVSATVYTFSKFIKQLNRSWCKFTFSGQASCFFDVGNGVVGTASACVGRISGPYLGGFYRCEMTLTAASTATEALYISIAESDNDSTFDGLNQDSLAIWGVQFEANDHASSYIPTAAAAVTRVADVLNYKMDDGNLANLKQGGMSCEILMDDFNLVADSAILTLSDGGSANDRIALSAAATDSPRLYAMAATVNTADVDPGSPDLADGDVHTVACGWQEDLFIVGADGVQLETDNSGATPDDQDTLHVGATHDGTGQLGQPINDIKIYSKFKCRP